MNDNIDIQHSSKEKCPVTDEVLAQWVAMVLPPEKSQFELTLRLVDSSEITELNRTYRKQDKATNVLAFPSALPEEIMQLHPFLGDIIICPAVLKEESSAQNTPLIAHWAHIVIHGALHLLGHDHIQDQDAAIMQALETQLLKTLGFDNPYKLEDDSFE